MYGPASALLRIASLRCAGIFDVDAKAARIDELEKLSGEPAFWLDADRAQKLSKERGDLQATVDSVLVPSGIVKDVRDMLELTESEGDSSLIPDLLAQIDQVTTQLDEAEFARSMSAPTDRSPALVQISAGAGGTESAD